MKTSIRLRINLASFVTVLLMFSFAFSMHCQETIEKATKITHLIVVDGQVSDSEWSQVPIIPLSQKVPNAGDPPTQLTEIRIAYDQEYLYLSGRMYDQEPEKMVMNSKKRDEFTENTEWCGLLIDTYNDRENALCFYVTPTGSRLDMALSNDAQGPTAFNLSWNSYWDAATSVTEDGWFAEMRIPFSSLAFESKNDQVIMGITTWRYFARNDETDIYPPRDLSTGSSFRPSLTQKFSFENIDAKNPLQITPYALTGIELSKTSIIAPNQNTAPKVKKEIGLDTKIGLGSNATLDLTINTDFAQVEADDQQVNLTRLNIFFPEKRLFFQERAGLFDFNFGNYDKLFHSRNIGIVDGEQVRIFGGVRSIAKFGSWEAGILNMQTGSSDEQESENFTVLRLRKRVLNENSSIGLIATNRTDFKGDYNSVYGIDATLKIVNQNYLSVRWAQSFSDGKKNRISSMDAAKIYLEWAKRSQSGLTYNLNIGRTGIDYLPGIGFEHRSNFTKLNYTVQYNFFPKKQAKLIQHGPYSLIDFTWGNEMNKLESRNVRLGYSLASKSGFTYDVGIDVDKEYLFHSLAFAGDYKIDPGSYQFNQISGSITSPFTKRLAYSVSGSTGSFYGGSKHSLSLSPFINITPDLIVEGTYEYNRLSFHEVASPVLIQLSKLKIQYTLSTNTSMSALIQHNSISKEVFTSLRVRLNPKEGNDFYLVYNGSIDQLRYKADELLPSTNIPTIFLKYSHTFHL